MREVRAAGVGPRIERRLFVLAVMAAVGAQLACSAPEDAAPPVAAATITLSQPVAEVGSPIEMAYRFTVAPDAPVFDEDYLVFVHFVDEDDELMWTDDHEPPTPTSAWRPGSMLEYARTMFIPRFPATGDLRIEVGLYSPATGARLPLDGEDRGMRSYDVGTLTLVLGDVVQIAFSSGWHDLEVSENTVGVEWQWSMQEATLSFRNPGRDADLFLQLDQPTAVFTIPQQVEIRIGDLLLDSFPPAAEAPEIRRIAVTADQFGTAEDVDVVISVDQTFVPAAIPALQSSDTRELGLRVFRAFVRPL